MKAIITKYQGPTNTKGARIKASAEGVPSLTIPYPYEDDVEGAHRRAAIMLCEKMGWPIEIVSGGLPDQTGYAHCFARQ